MTFQIPKTSIENYLTGITALNIVSKEGTGDWHSLNTFHLELHSKSFNIAGITFPSSSKWLGNTELFDSYLILKSMGVKNEHDPVWAATHYRAIVDYILWLVDKNRSGVLHQYLQFDEWFSLLTEKQKVYELLKYINNKHGFKKSDWINIENWVENEIYLNHFYVVNLADKLSDNEIEKGKKYFENSFVIDKNTWSFRNKQSPLS